jgi:lipopolysaccharide biosynthesis glycosyltransferase
MTLPSEQVTVVTAVNDNYVLPLAVMMRSVAQSLSGEASVTFKTLTLGLSRASRLRIEKSLAGLKMEFQEIRIDASPLEGLKVTGHVSLETYFRLLAPQYLQDLDKVLYLDVDLVVRHSIVEICREQLDGAHLLAVPHASKSSGFFSSERGVPSYVELGISGSSRTFNAGVMLLNLEAWRQTNTTKSVLEYLRNYSKTVLWWDQDGLNAVLHNKWRPLQAKWNVMTSHFADFETWEDSLLDATTFEAVRRDPAIIHYNDVSKPWNEHYRGPFQEQWEEAFADVAPYFTS